MTQTAVDNLDSEFMKWPNLEQPDMVIVPGRFFSYAGFWRLLTANAHEYHTNRAAHEGEKFDFTGNQPQPNLLTFEAGECSLVVFLIYADVVPALRRPSLAEYHQLLSGRRVRACQLVRVQRVMPQVPGEARFNTDPIEIVPCKSRQCQGLLLGH